MSHAHDVRPITVEVSSRLSSWVATPTLRLVELSKAGSGQTGRCLVDLDLGLIGQPGLTGSSENAATLVGVPSLVGPSVATAFGTMVGQWLRFSCAGDILGHYRIMGYSLRPGGGSADNADGVVRYAGACPLGALDQIFISDGLELGAGGVAIIGPARRINDTPGGNRSASAFGGVYINDPRGLEARERWTAAEYLATLFSGIDMWGVTLEIRDAGALDYYVERLDVYGHTVAQILSDLCGARRGLSYRVRVVGAGLVVSVGSAVDVAIDVAGWALPAADLISVDLSDRADVSGVEYSEDASGVADRIELHGACPWVMLTLATGVSLEPHWGNAEESIWNTRPDSQQARRVYSEYRLKADWDGTTYAGTAGLRNALTVAGVGGVVLDGSRTHVAARPAVDPQSLILTPQLPEVVGGVENAQYGRYGSADLLVCVGSGSSWDETGWRVSVEQEPARVILNDGANGAQVQAAIAGGKTILVTVGVYEAAPLQVLWASPWSTVVPVRELMRSLPNLTQWWIMPGAVTGVTDAGELVLSTDYYRDDNTTTLRRLLALAVAWYGLPQARASWAEADGVAAWRAYDHGDMLALTCGWDFGGPLMVQAVTLRPMSAGSASYWQAQIIAARQAPDLELII